VRRDTHLADERKRLLVFAGALQKERKRIGKLVFAA
jgi:hypothetical protein